MIFKGMWKVRSIRIPDDLWEVLKQRSKEQGISKAELIRNLIKTLEDK